MGKMRCEALIYLTVVISAVALLVQLNPTGATHLAGQHFLARRQSSGETEKESTTPGPKPEQQNSNDGQPQRDRLYPDLARGPAFLPPFNGHPQQQGGQMPPFVPYNMPFNMANGQRLNADQQPGPFGPRTLSQARPMTSAERSQSNAFMDGLGKRLLSLVGIHPDASHRNQSAQSRSEPGAPQVGPLQNVTVLNELNKRMGLLMSGLSKMYNSTVQNQLDLLSARFQEETKNGTTNSWQQNMAQRVPAFFNQMAMRVGNAQEQLNRAWRELIQVAQGKGNFQPAQSPSFFAQANQFLNPNERLDGPPLATFFGNQVGGNNFFQQIGQSLGLNNQQQPNQQAELATRLGEFWQQQVQPQLGIIRNQAARIWRDLTSSGTLNPNSLRSVGLSKQNDSNSHSDLVDNLLREADSESAEFALVSGDRNHDQTQPSNSSGPILNQQMFNLLINAQRDLNRVWQGLSQSLLSTVNNAKLLLNPQSRGGTPPNRNDPPPESTGNNEINDKVQELTKVQREADVLYNTIQQEQRESQQRQTLADRFRGFMNGMDLRNLNQLPGQIGVQVDRFGRVIGNFWDSIPERWENLVTQRQNQANQAKMDAEIINARTSTAKPATTSGGQNP